MITSKVALKRLQDGNQRFLTGVRSVDTMVRQMKRDEPVVEQAPFAIILGCSDSRVPAEIIFDQGLGDLFVNRIKPSVEPLFETELRHKPDQLLQAAIKSNIRTATSQLQHGSSVLEAMIQEGSLAIVGAEYSLQTGEVEFFDHLGNNT